MARPRRTHWRGAKAIFPFWEADGGSVHSWPRFTRWGLHNGATRRLTRYGRAVYFPGSSANEVETAEGDPINFASGEPCTLALLILWKQNPGTEGIFRSGSSSNGDWLWMTSSGKLWSRHSGVDSPASGDGPTITAGWHALVRVWNGGEVRQHVDGLRTSTTAVTATGAWTIHRWGWQFTSSQALNVACVPFFGAFGAAWDDAMVVRWSANPLAMCLAGAGCGHRDLGWRVTGWGAAACVDHCMRLIRSPVARPGNLALSLSPEGIGCRRRLWSARVFGRPNPAYRARFRRRTAPPW